MCFRLALAVLPLAFMACEQPTTPIRHAASISGDMLPGDTNIYLGARLDWHFKTDQVGALRGSTTAYGRTDYTTPAGTDWKTAVLISKVYETNSFRITHTTGASLSIGGQSGTGTCPAQSTYDLTFDSTCPIMIANPNNYTWTALAYTSHSLDEGDGWTGGGLSYGPGKTYTPRKDTTAVKDSVHQTTGGGGPSDGGSVDTGDWYICYDYYELDLTTGNVTFLYTTCPSGTYQQTDRSNSNALHLSAAANPGGGPPAPSGGLRALPVRAALVDHLPQNARVAVSNDSDSTAPLTLLVTASATDGDIAGAIETLEDVAHRGHHDAPMVAIPRGPSTHAADHAAAMASIRTGLARGKRRNVRGHANVPVTEFLLFVGP